MELSGFFTKRSELREEGWKQPRARWQGDSLPSRISRRMRPSSVARQRIDDDAEALPTRTRLVLRQTRSTLSFERSARRRSLGVACRRRERRGARLPKHTHLLPSSRPTQQRAGRRYRKNEQYQYVARPRLTSMRTCVERGRWAPAPSRTIANRGITNSMRMELRRSRQSREVSGRWPLRRVATATHLRAPVDRRAE